MRSIILYCLLIILSDISAQQTVPNIQSSIEIFFDKKERPYAEYELVEGRSVYQASKLFHTSTESILSFNNLKSANDIAKGTEIKVPIDFKYTYRGESIERYKNTKFIPLVYTVKPKENLYRIAKVYCGESVEDFMERNNLGSKDISIGQKLIVGWVPINPKDNPSIVKIEAPITPLDALPNLSTEVEITDDAEMVMEADTSLNDDLAVQLTREKGIAIWTKSSKGHSRYALHPTARINSEIELFNPVVNRKVKAKVIGRIPKGAYNSDVSVIISPATAVSLGALDNRFKVEMTYKQ